MSFGRHDTWMQHWWVTHQCYIQAPCIPYRRGWDSPEGSAWCIHAAPVSYSRGLHGCILMTNFLATYRPERVNFSFFPCSCCVHFTRSGCERLVVLWLPGVGLLGYSNLCERHHVIPVLCVPQYVTDGPLDVAVLRCTRSFLRMNSWHYYQSITWAIIINLPTTRSNAGLMLTGSKHIC